MNNWLNIIQNKWLTPQCIFCRQASFLHMDICAACFAELPRNHSYCVQCAESLDMVSETPQFCGRCLSNPPNFDKTIAPFRYESTIKYLITGLKFKQQFHHARLLADLVVKEIDNQLSLPACLLPMPLHPKRYQERQFNQSIELARHIGKQLKIPIDLTSCIRIRDTVHQTSLPAKQREKNMRNAFKLLKPIPFQHVAIIDDVLTTGATASALALALKQQGVVRVDVWVCARA